jgi:hypothetical protein
MRLPERGGVSVVEAALRELLAEGRAVMDDGCVTPTVGETRNLRGPQVRRASAMRDPSQ